MRKLCAPIFTPTHTTTTTNTVTHHIHICYGFIAALQAPYTLKGFTKL